MGIQLSNVTLTYNRHPAVHHLSAYIENGDFLALVGPNGAGKSTLLNALAGLTEVDQGVISGLNLNDVAYLPQQAVLNKEFPLTVQELVLTGLWRKIHFDKKVSSTQNDLCQKAISAVGLIGFERRLISTLSGGQLQRALFARVLVQDCTTILLDEPFNAIDSRTLRDLTQVIRDWHHQKRTILLVTHDLEYVRNTCPKTLLIARECIAYGLTSQVLSKENLEKAKNLVEAFDDDASKCVRNVA
jgi:zinc/manganese transport system ATP-binding protein